MMNLSCSARMIKYLMFVFNLFFVITGIALIAVGTSVKTIYTDYSYFLNDQYFSLPNMLIATGVIIFFISFFGCCGAIKENWILLGIFSILLIIIFIFEFSAGIAGYVLRDKTADYIDSALKDNLPNYLNETHAIWDLIQSSFQCCGVEGPSDWVPTFNDSMLPLSCCAPVSGTVGAFYCNSYVPITTSATNATTATPQSTVPSTTNPSTNTPTTPAPTTPSTTPAPTSPTTPAPTSPTTPTTPAPSDSTTKPPNDTVVRKRRDSRSETNVTTAATTTPAPTTPNKSSSTPYTTGCKSAFGDYIRKHAVQIGGCAMALAVIQLIGIFFSCHLVRQLKNGYYST